MGLRDSIFAVSREVRVILFRFSPRSLNFGLRPDVFTDADERRIDFLFFYPTVILLYN